jgi:hypothetical protein
MVVRLTLRSATTSSPRCGQPTLKTHNFSNRRIRGGDLTVF